MNLSSIIKNYGGHLAAYVVSAATIVAGLDPKLVPPQYSFVTALAGLVVTAGHHGYTSGTINGAVTAAANGAAAALSKVPAVVVPALAVILFGFGLSGCASTEAFFASPASAPVIESVVLVAVGTAEQKGVKAADINRIAKLALAADSGTQATLATVTYAVQAELATLNLPAADMAAAGILEAALAAAVEAKVGQNADVAATQANIATVLGYAIAATGG